MKKEEKENIEKVLSMNKTLIDNIYNACAENSEIFEVDYTPTAYLKMICEVAESSISKSINKGLASSGLTKTEKKLTKTVLQMVTSTLNNIQLACNTNAKTYHIDYVPIVFLKEICDKSYSKLETELKKGFGN